MATIKQIQANRRNAAKSTGPKTEAGKQVSKFNALVHGARAESAVLPTEDRAPFDQLRERLIRAWQPVDDQELLLVEKIAVIEWQLARLHRAEARYYEPGVSPTEFSSAIHRHYLSQARLERTISSAIVDLDRYRKQRRQSEADSAEEGEPRFKTGLVWIGDGESHYEVLPQIRGLDGVFRTIPREIMGDFSNYGEPEPADAPNSPPTPKPNGGA